jgi:hypothetical protein
MSQTDTPEQWRAPFPDTEISHVLAAVLRCSADLRKADQCEHENRVTIRLARLLVQDAVMLTRPVRLDLEAWEIVTEKAEILGRLDLRYLYSTGTLHPWPCFALEAKRLHVTFPKGAWKSLISEYVTGNSKKTAEEEQGMMCFVTGRYSGGLRAGAMIGYVYDADVARARKAVLAAVAKYATKLKLSQPHQVEMSSILENESRISESIHNLARGTFTIYHVLFSV